MSRRTPIQKRTHCGSQTRAPERLRKQRQRFLMSCQKKLHRFPPLNIPSPATASRLKRSTFNSVGRVTRVPISTQPSQGLVSLALLKSSQKPALGKHPPNCSNSPSPQRTKKSCITAFTGGFSRDAWNRKSPAGVLHISPHRSSPFPSSHFIITHRRWRIELFFLD